MNEEKPPLRALIVDDEVHGRDVVRHMLKSHLDITIVGEAANGVRALEEMRIKKPDVVFLDIRMPKLSGMELVDALDEEAPPVIVFISAHDDYAVQAFQRGVFDYLLKPFDQERFDQTIARVRDRTRVKQDADLGRRLREVLDGRGGMPPASRAPSTPNVALPPPASASNSERITRFVVKEAGRVFFIAVETTDWLEAEGNYVALHVRGKTHLIHEALANVERSLDPAKFLRIHRSTIVNVDRIKELQPFTNGEFVVILLDGTRLKLSRSFRARANEVLGLT